MFGKHDQGASDTPGQREDISNTDIEHSGYSEIDGIQWIQYLPKGCLGPTQLGSRVAVQPAHADIPVVALCPKHDECYLEPWMFSNEIEIFNICLVNTTDIKLIPCHVDSLLWSSASKVDYHLLLLEHYIKANIELSTYVELINPPHIIISLPVKVMSYEIWTGIYRDWGTIFWWWWEQTGRYFHIIELYLVY